MTTMRPTLPVRSGLDAYLTDIAQHLGGPRRHRRRILAELRDGLDEALTAHTTQGVDENLAVSQAMEQFGTPTAIADAFAPELATAHARRILAWFIATGPFVGIWWLLVLDPQPWRTGALTLLAAIPVIPLIVAAIATATAIFATTGRLMRWLPEASPCRALTAAAAVAVLALAGDITVITVYAGGAAPARWLAAVAIAGSATRIVCAVIVVRRVRDWRRRLAGIQQDRG
jgi:hypothetical protein